MRVARATRSWAVAALLWASTASAQVSDSERAAARDLFHQGDELQRAGHFAEALDKFQRAQQVFSAPTNLLRVAECEAALGRLVESAEAYREVARTPLPSGAPPAFQAAVDQAKAELVQVEPRVPKLAVVLEQPAPKNVQLQIDGQGVPSALIGEPVPLDPGTHRVVVLAQGYASAEQQVVLKERDTKTVPFALKAVAGVTYAPAAAVDATNTPTPPAEGASAAVPPPPPPVVDETTTPAPRRSGTGILVGAHLGWEIGSGQIPIDASNPIVANGSNALDTSALTGGGLAFAFDGGLRFARQWYGGVVFEHANLGGGNLSGVVQQVSHSSGDTTLVGLVLGLIVNPDRASFYAELGLGSRWFSFTTTGAGNPPSNSFNTGEVNFGAGLWLPAGTKLRILPKATIGLGTFGPKSSDSNQTHAFVMLGVAGFYNIDL
ncbi:MAG TPA: hypothetical protein VKU41_09730 [Polyangiaceae bacterium]|nr:hypothetical protein [Polyangiaceae bacterium]